MLLSELIFYCLLLIFLKKCDIIIITIFIISQKTKIEEEILYNNK